MNRKKIYSKLALFLVCATFLYGCGPDKENNNNESIQSTTIEVKNSILGDKTVKAVIEELVTYDTEDLYMDWSAEQVNYIELKDGGSSIEGSGVEEKDGKITITAGGSYVISGKLSNGQIVVDTDDTVRLILNGVEINCSDNAAIYVKNAKKTIISLEEGTENIISDGSQYILKDEDSDEPTAAIFSKDDIIINGSGKLIVKANYKDGITSKDDLKITGGNIEITSVDDGIIGKDLLAVKYGTITIDADGDALKASNDKDASKGNIVIENGTFTLKAEKDGMQAETAVLIGDGSFDITSGGGSANAPEKTSDDMGMPMGGGQMGTPPTGGGMQKPMEDQNGQGMDKPTGDQMTAPPEISSGDQNITPPQQQRRDPQGQIGTETSNGNSNSTSTEEVKTESTKAIKAGSDVGIAGGTFKIDSVDDAIHSNNNIAIEGGDITLASGDDGIHGEKTLAIKGGKITITKSYEGIEGDAIIISDGEINITATDDGINASGDEESSTTDQTGNQKRGPGMTMGNSTLSINGGYISITAGVDGLDANGTIYMTNGTVIISASNGGKGNGGIDYDRSFELTGGLLVSSGGTQTPSNSSSQYSLIMCYSEMQKAGTLVSLVDDSGKAIATFAPTNDYQTVVISSPELKKASTYTLYSGGKSTGTEKCGLYIGGTYEGGTKITSFAIEDIVTWLNESGVTEAQEEGMPGQGGGRG
ncbi:hypothetical protein N3C_1792 [Clostridium sp. N3C]|uniref:carbohydrate-binding domain-containing protein n=1 Tax=Clostridium sp. N3C TaxID=1776758 RepID=UPI00092E0D89|nr:carbohydrate-binding domain-containing protein [Clostridium sp. N3C]SCN24399.1 hypothetical protein N3C_1792 [Clostridium sp. N3C]